MSARSRFLLLVSSMVWLACGRPSAVPAESSSNTVSYESLKGEEGESIVRVSVNGKTIEASVNENGLEYFEAPAVSFDASELNDLRITAENFYATHIALRKPSVEDLISYQVLSYLSEAPQGHVLSSRQYDQLNLTNNGVTCVKRNTTVKAEWNTRSKSYVSEMINVGANWPNGYGCMGRCGAGCGWGAPSAWTKDCLDHDACSYRNNSSSGASDPNCGDEYNEAQDDWIQGVARGCSG